MTVGFHAPLPPAHTGVADYAARLLTELRKHGRVEVNAATADVHLYHLGNNQIHRPIYERAMAQPGVVVLHDAVLQHFYLGSLGREGYVEEFVYNYGEWTRSLAEELWQERAGSAMDFRYFARPMLRRVAEQSLCVIVHNCAAKQMVHNHAKSAQVVEINHFFDCAQVPDGPDPLCIRRRWRLNGDEFVFGVFGYLRESKRVLPILRCFDRVYARRPEARLLLAGSFASPDLARAVEPWLGHPGVIRMGHLGEREFWDVAGAVDCCLNLRHPGAGETSGIGIRLMGLGKPVFFTEGDEIGFVPHNACFRVSAGVEEAAELFEYMMTALELPTVTRSIGERGARYIREHHAIDRVGDQYWDTLCAVAARLSSSPPL